jgi:hypothetical protein
LRGRTSPVKARLRRLLHEIVVSVRLGLCWRTVTVVVNGLMVGLCRRRREVGVRVGLGLCWRTAVPVMPGLC